MALPKIKRGKERGLNIGLKDEIEGKFQFILMRHVIEHVDFPMEFIREIKNKYMDKGSILCIETPNNNNLGAIKSKNNIREDRFCRELYPPTHVCGFTAKTFKKMAEKLNLKIIKMTTYSNTDFWHYPSQNIDSNLKDKLKSCLLLNLNLAVFMQLI